MIVTVAIPVKNGGELLGEVLSAVRGQQLEAGVELELLACDSGSSDGSIERARTAGAKLITIEPREFSHGGTRNLLMERSRGELVAFLTQDAVPAGPDWLAELVRGFAAADDVALAFGPYLPRPDASVMVARELRAWFGSLSPDGELRIERLAPDERSRPARALYGARAFFTDANGCVRREAWERVRFPEVAYAEDHALAIQMLRAGYAKAYVPRAGVVHSHEYGVREWLRRSFDESRAVQQLYGLEDLGSLPRLLRQVRGSVRADLRAGATGRASLEHHLSRALGTALGARAATLPPGVRRRLSLEQRH